MKQFIACLLLGALLGIILSPVPAQQNQNQEMEALKKRVSELEKQLQTVENVEKLDLQAKLAEANAKLANAEFGKFERELRDSNNKWLTEWILLFLAILSAVGIGVWSWLKSRTNQLIENEVEKNLNGFKDAVDEQNVIKNQLGVLEKAHTASVLEGFTHLNLEDEQLHPKRIKLLREEVLLQVFSDGIQVFSDEIQVFGDEIQVFSDERYGLTIGHTAVRILAARESQRLVSPLLEFFNSIVNLDSDFDYHTKECLRHCVNLLVKIPTEETYQGLTKFLNRLLTEDSKHKKVFLTWTAFSLAAVSGELNKRDSVPILRKAIPHLDPHQEPRPVDLVPRDLYSSNPLEDLAEHFDKFNEPEGIKDILTNHLMGEVSGLEDVENRCLELLQKHDLEFVAEWRARETTENNA